MWYCQLWRSRDTGYSNKLEILHQGSLFVCRSYGITWPFEQRSSIAGCRKSHPSASMIQLKVFEETTRWNGFPNVIRDSVSELKTFIWDYIRRIRCCSKAITIRYYYSSTEIKWFIIWEHLRGFQLKITGNRNHVWISGWTLRTNCTEKRWLATDIRQFYRLKS